MVEINEESRGKYIRFNQIRFKTSMLRSNLCDYSNAYILVKGIITVGNTETKSQANNGTNDKVKRKNCAPFTKRISRLNNTQVNDTSYIGVVMPMCNLTEYSHNYLKTSGILWQYCRDKPAINAADGAVADFTADNTNSFKIKEKISGETGSNMKKNIEIMYHWNV